MKIFDFHRENQLEFETSFAKEFSSIIDLIELGIDALSSVLNSNVENLTDKQILIFRGVQAKIINCIGASLKLLQSGYYEQSLSIVRDLIEVICVSTFFIMHDEKINDWKSLEPRRRRDVYGTPKLLKEIKSFSSESYEILKEYYEDTSSYGVHANPTASQLQFDGEYIQVGPQLNKNAAQVIIKIIADLCILSVNMAGSIKQEPAMDHERTAIFNAAVIRFKKN